MKPESHSISDVLTKNVTSFYIPPFQRSYAWGKPEIERYFSDVLRIIDSELDTKQNDKLEHFFGVIVIKDEKDGFASKSVVVDGQQRLTTTLLFLIALRDLEADLAKKEIITQNYLTNNASSFQDKIKLKQVTKDWESYRALVNHEPAKSGIINNAYLLFSKLINDKKKSNPQIQFDHYIKATTKMNVAVIFLDERPFKGEDPQIIYETLNSLGKPLTLSDLVRNFVLLNMDSKNQANIYENTWHPKIESILNENTSEFFRDYLQYKKASSIKVVSDNNTKEVYHLFKDFVNKTFQNHKDFISDIVRYVNWYKWIITEEVKDTISTNSSNNSEIIELLRNIFHDIKAEAFKPFVLGLLEYNQCGANGIKLRDDMLISILKTIRTYLIRRRILGLSQGENKNIVLLIKDRNIEKLANAEVTMIDLLSNMFYKMRFPNNSEMEKALMTMDFYDELKKYSKFILGKIEEHNAKVAVPFRNPKIAIEHIMPQKLNNRWEVELGLNSDHIHKTYLHNIGNLILTEFNSEIGNKSFADKKVKLNTSSLNFRLDIINKDIWNETSIQTHQHNMITWFLETFPLPDNYQKKSNWNTKIVENDESNTFSPLDDDAGNMAQGNKPTAIYIGNTITRVTSWQGIFINFIKYIKENQDYDFDMILEENTVVKWATLKSLIDDNDSLTNRYKTFDGKIWDKVENLSNDELFIHTNFSASAFMDKIAKIMNKFSMPEDFVQISLK
ncbi:MAG: DUF262 domain-containing protein [Bacteroidetes bacterium]|nr:MAG: DUF262 domain-containing protein [Bacteroidota bacterium]